MKRLLVLSGKGGTGKTTIAAALVALLKPLAIADCDVDAPNLHLVAKPKSTPETYAFLGGDKAVVDQMRCNSCGSCESLCRFDAIHLEKDGAIVNEYLCEGCGVCVAVCGQKAIHLQKDVAGSRELYKNGRIFSTATLKMGRGNSGKLVSEVKRAMNQAAKDCDLAIIDGSPGIGCPVIASINGVDLVLVVAEPSGSGFSDLQRLIQTIESSQAQVAVCVNKWEVSAKHTQMIQQYCMDKGIPFVGKIPFDELAVSAVNEGKTIVDVNGPAKEAIKRMSEAVLALLDNKNKGEKLL